MKNKQPQAYTNPSYDKTQPVRVRVMDFLGAYHIILNGVTIHDRFDLRNEGKPNEMCDTEDKERFVRFIEELVSEAIENTEKETLKKCYQNAADNFGYLASSDGNLRVEAKALHEHFLKLANGSSVNTEDKKK